MVPAESFYRSEKRLTLKPLDRRVSEWFGHAEIDQTMLEVEMSPIT